MNWQCASNIHLLRIPHRAMHSVFAPWSNAVHNFSISYYSPIAARRIDRTSIITCNVHMNIYRLWATDDNCRRPSPPTTGRHTTVVIAHAICMSNWITLDWRICSISRAKTTTSRTAQWKSQYFVVLPIGKSSLCVCHFGAASLFFYGHFFRWGAMANYS